MAKRRIKKFSRRTHSQYKKSHAPIILSIAAFLLLSVIISVAVGISLGKRAENTSDKPRFEFDKAEYISNGKKITAREAYNFPYGAGAADYVAQDIKDFSVCIRHKDGSLDYYFETGNDAPLFSMNTEIKFSDLCESAYRAGGRVCAYMYITSFAIEDKYMRDMVKAYEISLIAEAARSGADDILLLGIEATEQNIAEVEEFVARAAAASKNAPLGVAVSEEILRSAESESYLGARLKSACDYLALDLTYMTLADGESAGKDENGESLPSKLEAMVEACEYYIKTYPVRLLFSKEYSRIYKYAIELGIKDFQIVGQ